MRTTVPFTMASTAEPFDWTLDAAIPGSMGGRALCASSPTTSYATAVPSGAAMHAPTSCAPRSQPTGTKRPPSDRRAISRIDLVGVSTTRRAENCVSAPLPALASTETATPARSLDHTAAGGGDRPERLRRDEGDRRQQEPE